jgi:multiple sugar transport system substrate-binding protein
MSWQRKASALLGAASLVAISACGAGTGSSGDSKDVSAKGAFNWKRYSGQTINVMLNEHPWTDGLKKIVPQFEKQTGIKVNLQTYSEELYFDKMEQAVRSSEAPDAYFLPMDDFAATHYAAHLMEPLTPYLDNKSLTEPGYDLKDIPDGLLAPGKFPAGKPGAQQYEIPVSTEAYILFYNKDLVDKYLGGQVPTTMPELIADAKKITQASGGKTYGAVMRGVRSDTARDTLTGFVLNEWPKSRPIQAPYNVWFDGSWSKPRLDDPDIVKGVNDYAQLLTAGPENKFNLDWNDCVTLFQQGKAAFFADASVFGPSFEDPSQSKVAGHVGYAVLPKTQNDGTTGVWSWALAMPRSSNHKGAAWTFMQWATDKQRTAELGRSTGGPPRQSAARDTAYQQSMNTDFVDTVKTAMSDARTTAVMRNGWKPGVYVIIDGMLAIAHGADPTTAMKQANEKMKSTIK